MIIPYYIQCLKLCFLSDYLYVKQHVQAVYAKILNTVELSVQCKPTMGASISIPFENPEGNSQSSVAKAAVQGDQSDSTYNFLSKGKPDDGTYTGIF